MAIGIVGCSQVKFDAEKPLAISVYGYRLYSEALNSQNRLIDRGLPAYIICIDQKSSGRWFYVMLGAASDETKIRSDKMRFEDKAGLQCEMELVNYHKIKPYLVEEDFSHLRYYFTQAKNPDVSPQVMNLVERLPYLPGYRLDLVWIKNYITAQNLAKIKEAVRFSPDFPRGLTPKTALSSAASIAHVLYRDELLNEEITLLVINLRVDCGLCFFPDLPKEIAQRILDTKKYKHELIEPLRYKKRNYLQGYYVEVAHKPESPKAYALLTDKTQSFLYIIEDKANRKSKILFAASQLAEDKKISNYESFANLFATLPAVESTQEQMVFYHFENRRRYRGRNSNLYRENYSSMAISYTPESGLFRYEVTGFADTTLSRMIYEDAVKGMGRYAQVELFGGSARMSYSLKRRGKTALPRLLHFYAGNEVGTFYNYTVYPLDSAEFVQKISRYQLGLPKGKKKFSFW